MEKKNPRKEMEEEILKQFTDCVYFLASPFTCKKGAECEYRHSEVARLNPRDCWYWLSGQCLNLACAFRHPPLEVYKEAMSEATAGSSQNLSSVPTAKTTVPCYYYSIGCCIKGDKCPFLHAPDDSFSWKPNVVYTIADVPAPSLDTKTTERIDTVTEALPAKKDSSLSESTSTAATSLQIPPKQRVLQSASNVNTSEMKPYAANSLLIQPTQKVQLSTSNDNAPALNTSSQPYAANISLIHQIRKVQSSNSDKNTPALDTSAQPYIRDSEEIYPVEVISLQPEENRRKTHCELGDNSDQSSEELVDGVLVRDECWESSPGLDVLVDERTEEMCYEDDPGYLQGLKGNDEDCELPFLQHVSTGYLGYGDTNLIDNGLRDPSELVDDFYRAGNRRNSPRRNVSRRTDYHMLHKRKYVSMELPVGRRNSIDLRDHLRKRRMGNSHSGSHGRRHGVKRVNVDILERLQTCAPTQRLGRRIASMVEVNNVGVAGRTSVFLSYQQGRSRNSRHNGRRKHKGMRIHPHSIESRQRPFPQSELYSRDSVTFEGPKRLAEIKEGKRTRHSIKNDSGDFEGPKPLSEILKSKKKAGSSVDDITN